MLLETAIGPIDDSRLEVRKTTRENHIGVLTSTEYYFNDVLVKTDQHLEVKQALTADGFARI